MRFLGKQFCVSRAPAAGIFRDLFSRDLIGLHNCTCVGSSLHMPTQRGFISGLVPLAAQRAVDTGMEQQGRPPLRRAMAWPWPLACKVRSGALGGNLAEAPSLIPNFPCSLKFGHSRATAMKVVSCGVASKLGRLLAEILASLICGL